MIPSVQGVYNAVSPFNSLEIDVENLPLNLHRLLLFHHRSAKEAARALNVSENSVSAWLGGTREPSGRILLKIGAMYDVDPRKLTGDPYEFAAVLGDADRMRHAEANLKMDGFLTEDAVAQNVESTERKLRAVTKEQGAKASRAK
jgi:transcriptional regulator with XRE-family HTH domain